VATYEKVAKRIPQLVGKGYFSIYLLCRIISFFTIIKESISEKAIGHSWCDLTSLFHAILGSRIGPLVNSMSSLAKPLLQYCFTFFLTKSTFPNQKIPINASSCEEVTFA